MACISFLVTSQRLQILLSFAVGGLLGDVFLHLLPEAWMYLGKGHSTYILSFQMLFLQWSVLSNEGRFIYDVKTCICHSLLPIRPFLVVPSALELMLAITSNAS